MLCEHATPTLFKWLHFLNNHAAVLHFIHIVDGEGGDLGAER